MYYPYCTIHCSPMGRDLEVVHTPLENGRTITRFELPDAKLCFKVFECAIPGYEIIENYGFNESEVEYLLSFCKQNAHLLLTYAKCGGIENA